MNSRKIILSTGTLPPAAVPIKAHMALKLIKLPVAAERQAKIPPVKMVRLKAGLRPIYCNRKSYALSEDKKAYLLTKSAEMLQNEAPRMRPT